MSALEAATFDDLVALCAGRRIAVLSGAGCSTESGIPDYRGPGTLRRARNPIQYRQFIQSPEGRARYWARSALGWPRFCAAGPNAAHYALAGLERAGVVVGVITQNVDRLHHAAGSERVVELHGALADVRCVDCGAKSAREALQQQLLELNPGLVEDARFELAPDGDADPIEDLDEQRFRVPLCAACGAGVLKPDVVFFGESVPRERVDRAWAIYEQAELLLVVGSSLAVFSGFRFPRRAAREGRDVAIVNLGPTRADDLCRLKLAARVGDVLPRLARALTIPADDGSAAS